jgi:hypothetical protein
VAKHENGNGNGNGNGTGRRSAITSSVKVLTHLVSEETGGRYFRLLIIADQSGFRHELTEQFRRQSW